MHKEIVLGPVTVRLPENTMAVLDGTVVTFHPLPSPVPEGEGVEDHPDLVRQAADLALEHVHPLADMACYVSGAMVSVSRNNVWE